MNRSVSEFTRPSHSSSRHKKAHDAVQTLKRLDIPFLDASNRSAPSSAKKSSGSSSSKSRSLSRSASRRSKRKAESRVKTPRSVTRSRSNSVASSPTKKSRVKFNFFITVFFFLNFGQSPI